MSIFNELLPKIYEISKTFTNNFNDDLKVAFECFDKFEEEFKNGQGKAREKMQKDRAATMTLQSINEDEDEPKKLSEPETKRRSNNKKSDTASNSSNESNTEQRASKKRTKNEVDGISSPEQDKRPKRNASAKAQSIISKQVNVNLTQKLRRENSEDKTDKDQSLRSTRNRLQKNDEKENFEPNAVPVVQIKQEKISLSSESELMDAETLLIDVEVKQEVHKDDIAMPPPAAPIPKPRKAALKEVQQETSDEEPSSRRTTRTKKLTDAAPPVPSARSVRASTRLESSGSVEPEPRPKRTRGRKKISQASATDKEDTVLSAQESAPASPAEKPRPKRTRRAQKAAEKEQQKQVEPEPTSQTIKEERISKPELSSPILAKKEIKIPKNNKEKTNPEINTTNKEFDNTQSAKDLAKTKNSDKNLITTKKAQKDLAIPKGASIDQVDIVVLDETRAINKLGDMDQTVVLPNGLYNHASVFDNTQIAKDLAKTKNSNKDLITTKKAQKDLAILKGATIDQVDNVVIDETRAINKLGDMDQTVVLPNGVYNHASVTPQNIRNMNETMVLEKCYRETMVLDKPQINMDATVVLDKGPMTTNLPEDNSLITDDSDDPDDIVQTPPKNEIPQTQPASAVKEKVQQFEELATRVTRTKTRAMAKKEDDTETQTPPDKISKAVLSCETLTKMNSLIFNAKQPQITSSESKPRANIPTCKSVHSSASKLSAINKAKEAAEESLKREDARKKKEAMLEAKREQQKRKREEKMAAAAAARSAAERERRAALCAAARERAEKQAHADMGKVERAREAERKKLELARKVVETEERRKAEETARQQRLEEEQKRAMAQRQKQIEEQEATKREAAKMAKEIEQRQREYIEKQKKQRQDEKMFKTPSTPISRSVAIEPTYMQDGFQYLNSDEEDETEGLTPAWSTSKERRRQLAVQSLVSWAHTERLFAVRVQSPDLRALFPNIERARLKRTSSAVWRTPPAPHLPPLAE